jgi:hypothetical protein
LESLRRASGFFGEMNRENVDWQKASRRTAAKKIILQENASRFLSQRGSGHFHF